MAADIREILRASALLAKLSDDDLTNLTAIARERSFAEGDVLTAAGSTDALGMWIIVEGNVEVSRDGKLLNTLGPGDHVGEMALMADIRRSADVTAKGDVRTLQLSRWDLRGLIADHPDIALAIMDAMATRLAEQNEV
jgi:CRP-like cAMP-binding protein